MIINLCNDKIVVLINIQLVTIPNMYMKPELKTWKRCKRNEIDLLKRSKRSDEDNLFKQTVYSGNFPVGSTKNVRSIYFLSGITRIFESMVNNPSIDMKSIGGIHFCSCLPGVSLNTRKLQWSTAVLVQNYHWTFF